METPCPPALAAIFLSIPLLAQTEAFELVERTDDDGVRAVACAQVDSARPRGFNPKAGVAEVWTPLGPFGGDVTDVCVLPGSLSVVLAGVAPNGGFGGTLYRSVDGGALWTEVSDLSGLSVFDLEVAVDGTLYAGTMDGVWKSADDGLNWTALGLGIGANDQTFEVTLDALLPGRLWAGVASALGSQTVNVLRSDNGGASWSDVTPPQGPMGCKGIAIDPSNSDRVFACFTGGFGGGAMWRSDDAGITWTDVSAGLPSRPLQDVEVFGTRVLVCGGLLFGSQSVGLYETVDDGATWTALHTGAWPSLVINDIEVDAADSNIFYLASAGSGVFSTADGGSSWSFGHGDSSGLSVNEVEVVPSGTAPLFLAASSAAVWKTDVSGDFKPASAGINTLNTMSVVANPLDPDELAVAFQGLNDGGVYSSVDGGQTWTLEPLPGTRFNTVAFAPDGTLYSVSDGPTTIAAEGVYRRDPVSWASLGPDQGPQFESELFPLVFSQTNPNLILTAGSDFGVAGSEATIWVSLDAGTSWTKAHEGLESSEDVLGLVIIPNGTDQDMVAGYQDLGSAQTGGILRSSDGGATWAASDSGLPAGIQVTSLAVSAFDSDEVYLADYAYPLGGVYRSTDGGQIWTSTGFSSRTLSVRADALRPDRLFITQTSGAKVSRSDDAGATFTAMDEGLSDAGTINTETYDSGDCGRIFLATKTGAYMRTVSCPLEEDVSAISASAGGTQGLDLAAGAGSASASYWVVGSMSGTSPGTVVAGLLMPLNFDAYFMLSLTHPNQVPLVNSFATLDATGQAAASFVVPPGVDPAFVGATFHHSYASFILALPITILGASNPVAVTITP